jgi:hypothetical protein
MASSNDAAPEEVAAVKRAPEKLGTFGDLLKGKK